MSDHKHSPTVHTGSDTKNPESSLVTFILLTLCCPLLFYYQGVFRKTEAVGELVRGADHRLLSDQRILRSAAGEETVKKLGFE